MIKYEQISYTIEENDFLYFEKNGVICQLRVDAEHLNEGKLLMDRFVVGSHQKIEQSEEGDLILLDVDQTSYVNSGLFADQDKSNIYLLDVKIIEVSKSVELLMYTETFEIGLDDLGSVRYFFIRMIDHVTVGDALASANLGEIIEDFLRSELN